MRNIVILSTGQSNMPSNIPFQWNPESNLRLWNFEANTQPSTEVGTGWGQPNGSGVGPSLAAANKFAQAFPDAMVYVINTFRGGLGIHNWSASPPDYNFRQAISANVAAALASIGETEIDYFIFGGCEADANAGSQTIKQDVNQMLFGWIEAQPWFTQATMSYIRGMSPWAAESPGNGNYRWRRYSRALEAVVSINPARRAFISTEDLPIGLFDPTGALPYIHMTGAGYYLSGIQMGAQMLSGVHKPIPKTEPPTYVAGFANAQNCSVDFGSATFKRHSDSLLGGKMRVGINATQPGTCIFDFTLPVVPYTLPGSVSGTITSGNGDSGVVIPSPNPAFLRAVLVAGSAGGFAACIDWECTVSPSD